MLWWTVPLLAAAGSVLAQEAASTGVAVEVDVSDPNQQPVPAVRLTWKQGATVVASGETDARGSATFHLSGAGQYSLFAVKEGFQSLTKSDLEVAPGSATVTRMLNASIFVSFTSIPLITAPSVTCTGAASLATAVLG